LILQNLTVQQNSGLSLTGICGIGARVTLMGVRVQNFQNSGVIMSAGDLSALINSPFTPSSNIQIQNNHTFESGGGIAILPGTSMKVSNISFLNNFADGSGGGLFMSGDGNSSIDNCTFSGNQASLGGGIYSVPSQYLETTNCTFANNNAFTTGGGIMTDVSRGATIHLNACILLSNTAPAQQGPNFAGPPVGAAASQFTLYGGPFDELSDGISYGDGDQTIQQWTASQEFTGLSNTGAPFFLSIFPLKSTALSVDSSNCFNPTDERGVARPRGPTCDKGAFER